MRADKLNMEPVVVLERASDRLTLPILRERHRQRLWDDPDDRLDRRINPDGDNIQNHQRRKENERQRRRALFFFRAGSRVLPESS